ncbi:hypothetical protein [Phormidesmis priestleyi]|uniref:hypothetical protein n=1 Tax=Phormidesmis priestleyi TaxID=268141 RepID=UPI0012E89201|nr:hypothetical protein [Phormidesmis priestleyi]
MVEQLRRKATGEFQYADKLENGCLSERNLGQITFLAELLVSLIATGLPCLALP